jgi:hypothetical protein
MKDIINFGWHRDIKGEFQSWIASWIGIIDNIILIMTLGLCKTRFQLAYLLYNIPCPDTADSIKKIIDERN